MASPAASEFDGAVSALYVQLRGMAAAFEFKPGERINESALSRKLGASRTPLREALNRLVAEGFIDFQSGHGFFCRALTPDRILNLYEARIAVECEATRRAALRAKPAELQALEDGLHNSAAEYADCTDPMRLLELDEAFHLQLCMAAANPELLHMLETIYDKIRFVRAADLRQLRAAGLTTIERHRAILALVRASDAAAAAEAMRSHIEDRAQHATEAVRLAYADLYVPAGQST
ncbi:MAG: GntR family transcriptional regulator [Pseudomonadota bacterium]